MPFEIVQIKAPRAAHSGIICQRRNAGLDGFACIAAFHELIGASLRVCWLKTIANPVSKGRYDTLLADSDAAPIRKIVVK